MRGFGVVPCWHISLKIGRFNVAKKSKKAKRGVPARKKKGMNKAKSAKRATVKKRTPKPAPAPTPPSQPTPAPPTPGGITVDQ
jgi:hypothetical protein